MATSFCNSSCASCFVAFLVSFYSWIPSQICLLLASSVFSPTHFLIRISLVMGSWLDLFPSCSFLVLSRRFMCKILCIHCLYKVGILPNVFVEMFALTTPFWQGDTFGVYADAISSATWCAKILQTSSATWCAKIIQTTITRLQWADPVVALYLGSLSE